MVRKHYPSELKAEAVALYRSRSGATIAQIADDLGINRKTLRSWIRIDEGKKVGAQQPGAAGVAASSDGDELAVEGVWELEEDRDILRKAARYFAGETRW